MEKNHTIASSKLRYTGTVILLAAVYLIAGYWGLKLAFVHKSATVVWPPSGIALATFLVFGSRLWPGVLLGAFLVNLITTGDILSSVGIAVGNTLEGVLGAYFVRRFVDGLNIFGKPQNVFKFVVLACMASTMVSATCGVTSLVLSDLARWNDFFHIWFTWWLGDGASILLLTPLLLLWYLDYHIRWKEDLMLEALALFFLTFFFSFLVFGGFFPSKNYPLTFLCTPPVIWAIFRFTQREVASVIFILSGIAIWGTLGGFGPFKGFGANESLLFLQTFIASIAIPSFLFSIVIVESRKMQESSIKSGERFLSIYEASMDAIAYTSLDGMLMDVNRAFEKMFGYSKKELVAVKKIQDLTPIEYHKEDNEKVGQLIQSGEPTEYEKLYIHKNGSLIPVELTLSLIRGEMWQPVGIAMIIKDITLRKRAEKKFQRVVESAPNGILMIDRTGRIILVNAQTERLFGYSREELIGQSVEMLLPKQFRGGHIGQRANFFADPENRPMGAGRDLHGLRKDGSEIPIEIGLNPMEAEGGLEVMASIIDITERKQKEEEVKKTNEELKRLSQIKSEFTSMVSHELRTPLSAIKEGICLVLDGIDGPVNKDQQESLSIAKDNVDRLARLINNVLDFSKLEAGKMKFVFEKTDLGKVMSDTYDLMKLVVQKKGLVFHLSVPEEKVQTICDADKIREVIINLVDNAIKFTQSPGRIEMRLSYPNDKVVIEVEDTGIGISKEEEQRLFQMFGQIYNKGMWKTGGSGIGLAICHQIIKQHGGDIVIESAPGKGTKFIVTFTSQRYSRTTDISSSDSKGLEIKPAAPASKT